MAYRILEVYTSIRQTQKSYSARAGDFCATELLKKFKGSSITKLNLAERPLPALTEDFATASTTPLPLRSEKQNQLLDASGMKALPEHDIYIFCLAGYMYDMPAVFKNFLEHMPQFDITITPEGQPLLKGKKAVVIAAWGGEEDEISPEIGYEYILRKAFAYLGLKDVEFFNIFRTDDLTATLDDVQMQLAAWVQKIN